MAAARELGILRSPGFDAFFVIGVPLIAIASALLVTWNNDLFMPVLIADLWILGYHHVVSTYTRLAFDREGFREHRPLILYLFPAVAGAVVLLAIAVGPWVIATVYLYWQWWHYTRQSEGISKAYAAKSREKDLGHPVIRRAAFYAVPIFALLAMSHRSPDEFLFMPVRTLPVPSAIVTGAGIVTAALLILWIAAQYRAYRAGRLAPTYVAYVMSHYVVYYFAYVQLTEINYGWLAINVWHNLQYILFVWLFNNRRFGTAEPGSGFLAAISRNSRFPLYFGVCLLISTAVYLLINIFVTDAVGAALAMSATTATLVIYQTINFHHYIVDSLIWKLRKPKLKHTLGLS